MNRQEAESILLSKFNLSHFYDEQWDTIEKILKGKRVLLIEKTGFGKSLCFQFPAVIFEGITVVFSPLIALMRDQVRKLNELGISAKCINSEQTSEENSRIIKDAISGKIKILYIAPERQENTVWIEATRQMNLSMVVVDEAHCISVWGHDFRPAFRRIINLVNILPKGLPVLATTATATKKVEEDVARQMGGNISVIRGNLMRNNFKLFVINVSSEDEKLIWLGKNLDKLPGSGILYTGTRVNTEIYSKWFEFLKISSIAYNAGLDADSRINIENGLMNNEWKCVISTNALGMGIDKPDIRFIIHTQIPQSPIHYYQEIGRAGRDNQVSYIILFYNPEDKKLPESFIEGGRPHLKNYERVINLLKNEMMGLVEIVRKTNLKRTPIEVILADLMDQNIIIKNSKKKYELRSNAPLMNIKSFEELREWKMHDLSMMIGYINTTESRMKYLCNYLGDSVLPPDNTCDNTGLKKITVSVTSEWVQKLQKFREEYFPVLEVSPTTSKKINDSAEFYIRIPEGKEIVIYRNHKLAGIVKSERELNKLSDLSDHEKQILSEVITLHKQKKEKLINGVASSYYGVSNVGAAVHRCKYENGGDFPEFLLKLTMKAFYKKFGQEKFDLILYVPPTKSGDLVKNFATKISLILKIPISHNLIKKHATKEQKVFENAYLKADNVKDVFLIKNPEKVKGKSVLLIDDIYDSGATVKEIGRYLSNLGALKIAPLVIARTVGGDLV